MFTESRLTEHSQNDESVSGQSQNYGHEVMASHEQSISCNETQKFTRFGFLINGCNANCARMLLAELLGTFILLFSICGIIVSKVGLLEYAITAGSAIIVITFSLGSISGAHINPAITIALAIFGHFPLYKVPLYVSAQLLGSVLATYVGGLVYQVKPELILTQPAKDGIFSAFWAELIASCIIAFLATSLARDAKSVGRLSELVIGISITLAVLITGPISGGSMNPARSLGPAFVSRQFNNIWIYIVAPTLGAVLGVLLVHVLCLKQPSTSSNSSTTTTNSIP